ncbi:MAG: LLM class flavin-dependent oxidoreductase [Chloroflexi bacterium]|nr:LLM class flavin-dependent oxidoreductase [Chloroflexota bacterium]
MEFHTFHLLHWPDGWSQQDVYKNELEMIQYSEELGFDGVWIAEHHFRNYGICPNIMPFAAFVAARTTKIKIGTAVVVLPFHNPLRAAEDAAIVDMLSNGRLLYGFGRGYQSIEFQGFNISLNEARERTDEAIDIMRLAWTQDHFDYDGKFTKVENVTVNPKPLQKPHPPMWTATVTPDTVGHYAKKGIPFITDPLATFGRLKKASDTWREVAAENGFDTTETNFGTLRGLVIAETEKEAWEMAKRARESQKDTNITNLESAPIEKTGEFAAGYYYWKDRYLSKNASLTPEFFWDRMWVAGDPDRCVGIVKNLESMGFKHLLFTLGHPPHTTMEENKRRLKLFADAVMPHFRSKVAAK